MPAVVWGAGLALIIVTSVLSYVLARRYGMAAALMFPVLSVILLAILHG